MPRFSKHALGAGLVTALAALCLNVATATAAITGPCSATINGVDVKAQGTGATASPIVVAHDATVPVGMTAATGKLSHVKFTMSFAWFSWTVTDKDVSSPTYSDTVPVHKYAKYGVGLYKVAGSAVGANLTCSGSALVKVQGSFLSSYAGIAGLVVTILGGVGILMGVLGGSLNPFRLLRGGLAGLITGAGVLVLLQQASVLYPTSTVATVALALGAIAGGGLPALTGLLKP